MLLTNRQRLERICKALSSAEPAKDRLRSVAKDVSEIDQYRFVSEPGLTVDQLLGAVKLLARTYLEAHPAESEVSAELKAVADSKTSDTFDALHALRLLDDKITKSSWTSAAAPEDPRPTVSTLVHSAWHYTFMTYFYVEKQARRSS